MRRSARTSAPPAPTALPGLPESVGTGFTWGMAPRVGLPAAWVVLCTLLCADATSYIHTDLGPYPGPDHWADVPQATRRVRTRCTTANFLNTAEHGSLTPARMPVRRQWAAARLCTRCRSARRGGCSFSCTATCSTPTSGACRRPLARTAPARTRAPAAQHGVLLVPAPPRAEPGPRRARRARPLASRRPAGGDGHRLPGDAARLRRGRLRPAPGDRRPGRHAL